MALPNAFWIVTCGCVLSIQFFNWAFLFEMNDLALVGRALVDHLLKQLLEQNRIAREVFGHGNHAADYTESGDVSRRQNLMETVTPEVEAIEQPVQFLNGQDNGDVSRNG